MLLIASQVPASATGGVMVLPRTLRLRPPESAAFPIVSPPELGVLSVAELPVSPLPSAPAKDQPDVPDILDLLDLQAAVSANTQPDLHNPPDLPDLSNLSDLPDPLDLQCIILTNTKSSLRLPVLQKQPLSVSEQQQSQVGVH